DVDEVEIHPSSRTDGGEGKGGQLRPPVHVAPDGRDGCDLPQTTENDGITHISQVEDAVRPRQEREDFRSQEAVGIREDSEDHGSSTTLTSTRAPGRRRPRPSRRTWISRTRRSSKVLPA